MPLIKYVVLLCVYVAVAAGWIYLLGGPWWALAFLLFNAIVGFLAGTWWALLLPVTLGPLSAWTTTGDAGPGWQFALLLVAPLAAAGVAVGVGAKRWDRRSA